MSKFKLNYSTKLNQIILIKKIKKKLNKYGFCILKNINSYKVPKQLLGIIHKKSKKLKDIRLSGPHTLFSKDYKRLDIGDTFKNPKFLRIVTFYEWNIQNKKFFKLIKNAIEIRNNISNSKKESFFYPEAKPIGSKSINKKYVYSDFVRMIQYPKGGGFLSEHNDYDKYYCKDTVGMLIPITVKSKKNNCDKRKLETYTTGGLYFVNQNKKIFVERWINAGDIIFFDPKIKHGVLSVDPHKNVELSSINGRRTLAFSISRFLKR